MRKAVLLASLDAALAALILLSAPGCDRAPPLTRPATLPNQATVLSARVEANGVLVERRTLSDEKASEVNDSLSLAARSAFIERLEIGPTGEYFFISAWSDHVQSFPVNNAAVHTVWILRNSPLTLIRELALPEGTTSPYWQDGRTLRFASGDGEGNAVDYRVDAGGSVVKSVLTGAPAKPASSNAEMAAKVLGDRGLTFYTHSYAGGDIKASPEQRVGHTVVSDDGTTVAANVLDDDLSGQKAVVLRKRDGKWELFRLPGDTHRIFALHKQWVAVIRPPSDGGDCQIFGEDLSAPFARFMADAVDLH